MNDSTPAETDVPLYRPATLTQALALLRDNPDARPLGGGQTLVPMLTLGYAQVSAIIALADIAELHGITRLTDGSVRIGAMTTHAEIAACTTFVGGQSLLSHTAGQIADPAIRSFGTIGGACAHGDTVADWPPSLVAADARVVVAGPGGNREIRAQDFFLNILTTALEPGELVVAIVVPALAGRAFYRKLARVEGDYATVSVAVVGAVDKGICKSLAIAIGACGPAPVRLASAEALLVGRAVNRMSAEEAGTLLARATDPISDVRGSAAYRKRVLPRIVAETVLEVLR